MCTRVCVCTFYKCNIFSETFQLKWKKKTHAFLDISQFTSSCNGLAYPVIINIFIDNKEIKKRLCCKTCSPQGPFYHHQLSSMWVNYDTTQTPTLENQFANSVCGQVCGLPSDPKLVFSKCSLIKGYSLW